VAILCVSSILRRLCFRVRSVLLVQDARRSPRRCRFCRLAGVSVLRGNRFRGIRSDVWVHRLPRQQLVCACYLSTGSGKLMKCQRSANLRVYIISRTSLRRLYGLSTRQNASTPAELSVFVWLSVCSPAVSLLGLWRKINLSAFADSITNYKLHLNSQCCVVLSVV
jgi:hypothetical protein